MEPARNIAGPSGRSQDTTRMPRYPAGYSEGLQYEYPPVQLYHYQRMKCAAPYTSHSQLQPALQFQNPSSLHWSDEEGNQARFSQQVSTYSHYMPHSSSSTAASSFSSSPIFNQSTFTTNISNVPHHSYYPGGQLSYQANYPQIATQPISEIPLRYDAAPSGMKARASAAQIESVLSPSYPIAQHCSNETAHHPVASNQPPTTSWNAGQYPSSSFDQEAKTARTSIHSISFQAPVSPRPFTSAQESAQESVCRKKEEATMGSAAEAGAMGSPSLAPATAGIEASPPPLNLLPAISASLREQLRERREKELGPLMPTLGREVANCMRLLLGKQPLEDTPARKLVPGESRKPTSTDSHSAPGAAKKDRPMQFTPPDSPSDTEPQLILPMFSSASPGSRASTSADIVGSAHSARLQNPSLLQRPLPQSGPRSAQKRTPIYGRFKQHGNEDDSEQRHLMSITTSFTQSMLPKMGGKQDQYSFEVDDAVKRDTLPTIVQGETLTCSSALLNQGWHSKSEMETAAKRSRRGDQGLISASSMKASTSTTSTCKGADLVEEIRSRRRKKGESAFITCETVSAAEEKDASKVVPKLIIRLGRRSGEELPKKHDSQEGVARRKEPGTRKKASDEDLEDPEWTLLGKGIRKRKAKQVNSNERKLLDVDEVITASKEIQSPTNDDCTSSSQGLGSGTTEEGQSMHNSEKPPQNISSACNDLPKGTFLVAKSDIFGAACCLWRVDSASLLQKYTPVPSGDGETSRISYRNAPAFACWCPNSAQNYFVVDVDYVKRARGETIVRPKVPICELFPAWSCTIEEKATNHDASEHSVDSVGFNEAAPGGDLGQQTWETFVRAMLRHACTLNFLQDVESGKDWNYLSILNEIDRRNSETKERVRLRIRLEEAIEFELQVYSSYRTESVEKLFSYTSPCQNCGTNAQYLAMLFGVVKGDMASPLSGNSPPPVKEYFLCEECEAGARRYHKLHHMPYHLFRKCEEQLEKLGSSNPELDMDTIIQSAIGDAKWFNDIVAHYTEAWKEATSSSGGSTDSFFVQ